MAGVTLQLYTVDAFTDVPFKGNPAAICPLPSDVNLDDDILQKIAVEMNLSDTAFIKLLHKSDSFKESNTFGLRWFTPKDEVKLCGHATLASAAVLFGKLDNKHDRIVFKTLSGDLIVQREGQSIHMDFPVGTTVKEDQSQHEQIVASLGDVSGISDIVYCDSLRYLLVRLHDGWSREEFETWTPDISAMERSADRLFGLIVTTRGPPGDGYQSDGGAPYDFVSRCFVPWGNIPEDPVTGSAQTVLAHYWAQQLGKNDFFTRQCSARGGEIVVKLRGDRVELLGKAAFVMDGVMKL
ncbi:phenazine biosynthesis-like domain-containing protein 1 isoform X1 [Haliotis rufescens]|uniref:phenazine biosynthesis-like domain-containing protein 1 isoform X1 n=1 Tax=Haliotis rufescens TaxID=6454 RepID=UPI00201F47B3|nr:phenazine biosynthesis-like domain-containing protein 1 isoform X1 [Haliotis rufescens]